MILKITIIFILILMVSLLLKINYNKSEKFENDKFKHIQFIHIPKTAGSSIEKQALKYNIYWGKLYFINKVRKNYNSSVSWHIPPKYLTNNVYENKILFCVIRNPYKRIVSEYKYKGYKVKKDLNEWIKSLPKKLKNNPKYADYHFVPQIEYIKKKDNSINKNIHILKFETLDKDFKDFAIKYNLPFTKLPVENKSTNYNNISVNDLSQESKKIIQDLYKEDFEYFNYKM